MQTAIELAQKVRTIGNEARKRFVAMGDVVDSIELGMVAGEHVLVIGTFGTAKSAAARFFGAAAGLSFYRRVLNPDTTRDEIIGTIDPAQLQQGVWSRKWAGFATAQVGFADEFGKGGSQVQNMFVDLMEERLVSDSYGDKQVPLHFLVAATNELFEEESGATWDRFSLRVEAKPVSTGRDFISLLDSDDSDVGVIEEIKPEELQTMRDTCKSMANRLSDDVKQSLVKLWSKLPGVTEYRPSNRRWKKVLRIAAAHALLDGRNEIHTTDLVVSKHMLWQNLAERGTIGEIIQQVCDAEGKEINDIRKAMVSIQDVLGKITTTQEVNLETIATTNLNIDKLINHTKNKTGDRWDHLRSELQEMKNVVSEHFSI